MALNCRPGDLAVVVRVPSYGDPSCLGKLVTCIRYRGRCVHLESQTFNDDLLEVDAPWAGPVVSPASWLGLPDACLRPIRDPGDDAVDETLLWVPAPGGEVVA